MVISHSENWGYNHFLRKNFEGNYHGNYKIIKEKELTNYPADKYRYVFDYGLEYNTQTTATTTNTAGGRLKGGATNTSYNSFRYVSSSTFFVTDRQQKKDYVTISSAKYSKLMRAYIKVLDKERQQ